MGVYVHPFFVYIGNNINVSKVLSSQVNKKNNFCGFGVAVGAQQHSFVLGFVGLFTP